MCEPTIKDLIEEANKIRENFELETIIDAGNPVVTREEIPEEE